MNSETILNNVTELAREFAQQRGERQRRRELVKEDFDRIRAAGYHLAGLPPELGGVWTNSVASTRLICDALHTLAQGDSSVALVSSMHHAVLLFWLATVDVPAPYSEVMREQRHALLQSAAEGAWWGTIMSEPGSGGDLNQSNTLARKTGKNGGYCLTGQKHFGSGSGNSSFMITHALPEGEESPDFFYMDMRGVPWDGTAGVKLIAPWDGHGMTSTQSHGMAFEDFPATRIAWPGNLMNILGTCGPFTQCTFVAVIAGIVKVAVHTARDQLKKKSGQLRAYEQVEWNRVEQEAWLVEQAYKGMLEAVEKKSAPRYDVLCGKLAVAELAESLLGRICKVIGGGSYSRHSPFGYWFEDVRAIGFLRPPWGLAHSALFDLSLGSQG